MSENRWDKKYRVSDFAAKACYTLRSHRHLFPPTGKALDLACGLGGNAIYLAQAGLSVEAWDYSNVALKKLNTRSKQLNLDIKVTCVDLEQETGAPFVSQDAQFDLICVSNYLHRPLFKNLVDLLKPQGLLIYETFYYPNNSGIGPKQERFLLQKEELTSLMPTLTQISYWHSTEQTDHIPVNKAFYCARKLTR